MKAWIPGLVLLTNAAVPAFGQTFDRLAEPVKRYVTVSEPTVALTNVRVIDGTGAPARESQTIVIAGGRIKAVGSAGSVTIPAGARVMDLAGHTVIPGIVGMHDHIHYSAVGWRRMNLGWSSPRLYLASGVTTVRATGSIAPYEDLNLKRDIDAGKSPGPRIHLSGPYLTGPSPASPPMNLLDAEDEARRAVRYWAEEGATWFKMYTNIRRAELRAVVDEAHKLGLKVTGHLCAVGFKEAAEAGIDNLDHGLFVDTEFDPAKVPDQCPSLKVKVIEALDLDGPAVRGTFKALIDRGIPITSTLPVIEALTAGRPSELDPRLLEFMYPAVRDAYLKAREKWKADPATAPLSEAGFKKVMAFEREFVKAGGRLAAGVDPTGSGGALAGLGDQRNFALLQEAGFTPLEAIQIMTLNGATILGVAKDVGSIEAGKYADLAVIAGDPMTDPNALRKIVLVFKEGVGYDPAPLYAEVKGLVGLR
jgi:imidazolonepropionase-like amidohydrolase